jgi:predicted dehydrogenase
MAEVYVAAQQPNGGDYRTFEILGTNGSATVRPFSPYRLMVDLQEAAGPYRAGRQTIEMTATPGPPFAGDFAELARVIRDGEQPSHSAEHDLITHEAFLKACKVI